MKRATLSETITQTLSADNTVVEPVKSTRLRSVRELKYGPQYIVHRFKIKGGVPLRVIMMDNISKNNALLERLKKRA